MEKQINYGSYAGYKETVGNLTADLQELLKLSEEISQTIEEEVTV